MRMDTVLEARDLSVGYRKRGAETTVLSGLDLTVRAGELVCLLGPNGIGKSTLLRTIARVQSPLRGNVVLGGADIGTLSQQDLARLLGVVLTERVQVGALPAHRVVSLGRYAHLDWSGRLRPHDHDVVRWAIRAVGAEHLARRDSTELSDGERQRIMIARALAQEPRLLLLDEPTAFLDVPSRVDLMGLLRQLAREEGLAIVVSTHDLELALRAADTVWLVAPGGRLYAGCPEDVVRAGRVADTFSGRRIYFNAEERAFRLVASGPLEVSITGEGLDAALAASVLEREGFRVAATGDSAELHVATTHGGSGWEGRYQGQVATGEDFASLARFARTITGTAAVR